MLVEPCAVTRRQQRQAARERIARREKGARAGGDEAAIAAFFLKPAHELRLATRITQRRAVASRQDYAAPRAELEHAIAGEGTGQHGPGVALRRRGMRLGPPGIERQLPRDVEIALAKPWNVQQDSVHLYVGLPQAALRDGMDTVIGLEMAE